MSFEGYNRKHVENGPIDPKEWAHKCRSIIHDASIVLEIAQKAEFEGYADSPNERERFAFELRGMISGLVKLAQAL